MANTSQKWRDGTYKNKQAQKCCFEEFNVQCSRLLQFRHLFPHSTYIYWTLGQRSRTGDRMPPASIQMVIKRVPPCLHRSLRTYYITRTYCSGAEVSKFVLWGPDRKYFSLFGLEHMESVAMTQLCPCSAKTATDNALLNGLNCVQIKLTRY